MNRAAHAVCARLHLIFSTLFISLCICVFICLFVLWQIAGAPLSIAMAFFMLRGQTPEAVFDRAYRLNRNQRQNRVDWISFGTAATCAVGAIITKTPPHFSGCIFAAMTGFGLGVLIHKATIPIFGEPKAPEEWSWGQHHAYYVVIFLGQAPSSIASIFHKCPFVVCVLSEYVLVYIMYIQVSVLLTGSGSSFADSFVQFIWNCPFCILLAFRGGFRIF